MKSFFKTIVFINDCYWYKTVAYHFLKTIFIYLLKVQNEWVKHLHDGRYGTYKIRFLKMEFFSSNFLILRGTPGTSASLFNKTERVINV